MKKQQFRDRIEANIRESGRSVIHVVDGDPTFSYSIGNHLKGIPELIVFQMHGSDAQTVINLASDALLKEGPDFVIRDRDELSIGGRFPLALVNCADVVRETRTLLARHYVGTEDYRVVQVVLCDQQGRFPWDEGCDPVYRDVPIMARRLN